MTEPPTPPAMAMAGVRLLRLVARRPFSDCYRGEDVATGTPLFVKRLTSARQGVARNFGRERACLAALQGTAGVPRLVAHGADPPFHACAWITATPLPVSAARADSLADLLAPAAALAERIAALHARGYAHRDLSPDHVFLDAEGAATIVDFGMAKPDAGALERGYDLQAIGMILWELVCGRPLFAYRSPAIGPQIARQRALIARLELGDALAGVLRDTLGARSELVPEGSGGRAIDAAGLAARLARMAARDQAAATRAMPRSASSHVTAACSEMKHCDCGLVK